MSILATIHHRFGFTRNELIVILFLSSTLCAGMLVKLFMPSATAGNAPQFSYAQADSEYLALAQATAALVVDEPSKSGGAETRAKGKQLPPKGGIDINAASAQELARLPGIGPATAERIIEYRKLNGRFQTVDDLTKVKGIGAKKLEKLRPYAVTR